MRQNGVINEDLCALDVNIILFGLCVAFSWEILLPGRLAPFVVYSNPIPSFVLTNPIDYGIVYCG